MYLRPPRVEMSIDKMPIEPFENDRVVRVAGARLTVSPRPWHWARRQQEEIDVHWLRESGANANFFNGTIYLIDALSLNEAAATVTATLLETDFKSYLYWRDLGYPPSGVLDGFGSALIRCSDGAVILGRQQPGNINSGLAYLPGGFIDGRDAQAGGVIDIRSSVLREVVEETGLHPQSFTIEDGLHLTLHKAHVSFAVTVRSPMPSHDLIAAIGRHIASQDNPELAEAVAVSRSSDLEGLPMPGYARVLLTSLLD